MQYQRKAMIFLRSWGIVTDLPEESPRNPRLLIGARPRIHLPFEGFLAVSRSVWGDGLSRYGDMNQGRLPLGADFLEGHGCGAVDFVGS